MTTNRDAASIWWRPVGFWGLTINAIFGYPCMVFGAIIQPDAPWPSIVGAYTSVLLAWAAAAGIRQWGKSNGSEKDYELSTGETQQERIEGSPPIDGDGCGEGD